MIKLVEWVDVLPIVRDVLLIIATAIATALFQAIVRYYRERKSMYRGFLKEIRQNIRFAEHNIEKLKNPSTIVELVLFRDDFWKMSISGYLLTLASDLQDLLYEIYMKQYVMAEMLYRLRDEKLTFETGEKITTEIKKELLPKLKKAEKRLEKKLDP